MKPQWEQFVKEQRPADKPTQRPVKRFVELPGGVLKRKAGSFGGPSTEKGMDYLKKKRTAPEKKSSGYHTTSQAGLSFEIDQLSKKGPAYSTEAEAYRRFRAKQEIEGKNFTDPEGLPYNLKQELKNRKNKPNDERDD